MTQPLDPNLQGLAAVLVDVLIREIERESAESSQMVEPDSEDDDHGRRKIVGP